MSLRSVGITDVDYEKRKAEILSGQSNTTEEII